MTKGEKKKVIKILFEEGRKKKEIARLLNVDPKTVRKALAEKESVSSKSRSDKKILDVELLRKVYNRCEGYVQRVYEILTEEFGVEIGYSTLTRMIRHMGIGQKINKRCHQVDDEAGAEMQHDTSTYQIKIGKESIKVIGSGLYLRYSKMRYLKFYRNFNRFKMKCFFNEALTHWGYAAGTCVIDNTNLAVLHGTGGSAVFNPEMISFARAYGFEWFAHEKGHANRKAGKERNFWTIETNFIPGRTFESMEDINRQAFEWAALRYSRRPLSRTRLIPVMLFEKEKPELIKLPVYVEPPSVAHKRKIDQYGYIAFEANYYWIPGKSTGEISVIEYSDRLKVFPVDQPPIEYPLPEWKVKNKKFKPPGVNTNPYEPKNIKKPCHEEEKRLKEIGDQCCKYLTFIKSTRSGVRQKAKFIRALYALSKKMTPHLFMETIDRALKYGVTTIEALTRISRQLMKKGAYTFPEITATNDYEHRESYRQGRFSQEAELKSYEELIEDQGDTYQ